MQNVEKVKILFVEDMPTDFELAKREIQKGNVLFDYIRVDEKESFLKALNEFQPDIIVSDFSMPTFDGLQVIKLAEKKNPLLPVVILTGSINEYTAVECMKSGAADYVIKESITRLPFAVKDALEVRRMKEVQLVAESALQESEEKYRQLYDSMMDAFAVMSMDGKFIQWNKSFENMLGYDANEIPNLSLYDITPKRWHSVENKIINEQVIVQGYSEVYEKEFSRKNKNILPVEVRTFLMRDAAGNPDGMWSIVRNITERKNFEDQLKTFKMATEQSPASIIITNTAGKIEFVNNMFSKISGYSKEEIIGQPLQMLNLGNSTQEEFEKIWNILNSGAEWKAEYETTRKDGLKFWQSTLVSAIKDKDGNITHMLAIQEDITERKEYEMELMNAKKKAEEMNRLKSNFLANMSHELRTPLVGMLGFSELLYNELEGQNREFIQMINKSSQRLLSTLNTLLNYSKIESEKLESNLGQVSIANLIKEEVKLFEAFAKQNGLYIKDNICCNNFMMKSDEKMLKEIIDNLINNAIRFTKEGGVSVSLLRSEKEITIKVADTGIGIPEDKLQTIFEEFRQVSEGKGRNFEGTGLGLTIVKKYVLALNGTIIVESELNKGSEFIITFPVDDEVVDIIEPEEKEPIKVSANEITKTNKVKHKILLVEDDSINSFAISRMLQKDYEIVAVDNAEDAINQSASNHFDVILMDINLKTGKSGIEAAQEIRKFESYVKTPIVAMTAYAMNEDRIDFLKSGCSHYLSKPFTQEMILKLLADIFASFNEDNQ